MAEIHSILEKSPHISGDAVCLACRHEWVAVAPCGETCLDCPECKTYRGVFKGHPMDWPAYECNCGSYHFSILTDLRAMCLHCGVTHFMGDDD